MRRHEARAHNRLSIANGRIKGRRCKDTLFKEPLGEGKCLCLATDKNGNNRCLGCSNLESDRLETLVHLAGVTP